MERISKKTKRVVLLAEKRGERLARQIPMFTLIQLHGRLVGELHSQSVSDKLEIGHPVVLIKERRDGLVWSKLQVRLKS